MPWIPDRRAPSGTRVHVPHDERGAHRRGACSCHVRSGRLSLLRGIRKDTRAQGRPIGQKDPTKGQVPIIEHADIRRMLMAQKAAVEGAQSLCLYCAMLIDALVTEDNPDEAKAHAALLGLLTPVVKSWPA